MTIRLALTAFAPLALSACVVIPDAPNVAGTPVAEGTAVGLLQPVRIADVVVTPIKVAEDSRCPINARCVWAGRLIVETRIDGEGWRDTANITLGETFGTHGRVVALVAAAPDIVTEREARPSDYRFTYEAR
ncbi:hypothetical protein [Qipengyuania marisflavi]|uniref:Lipoprotein n=1 Tax=Qipengyuania marisflavi TaxID=2486356 RepID=A0A5S3PDX5_9SPHN|nr:hypothetical protein [Qipengyuania marisflavi]TMM49750.1 hypothetical protein FEV51_00660 [Qipengyuania marisflavi]